MYQERQDLEDALTKWEFKANWHRINANACKTAAQWYLGLTLLAGLCIQGEGKLITILPAIACYHDYREMKKNKEKQERFQRRADYRKELIDSTWS
jgi:hypothetical protein